ncbi:MAG TPA: biopolymer transporter ExbD [Pirellulaceae bacterium]|nr:biopolymer transporter ExbD [Pirellulaceae bacterium]
MRFNKRARGGALGMNMTPMIDVVFLLLIYFMTAMQVKSVSKEDVELPPLAGSQEQSESSLTVNVMRSGEIFVNGNPLTVPQLASLVGDELARVDNEPSRVSVVVRADRRGRAGPVNQIVSALERFDIRRVNIGVQEPRP